MCIGAQLVKAQDCQAVEFVGSVHEFVSHPQRGVFKQFFWN